jgi:hypothetical protein
MDRNASLLRNHHGSNIFVAAVFVFILALQPGYSEDRAIAPELARVTSGSADARISARPFSHLAFGLTAGTFGIGAELATPLSRRANLRVDGQLFNYSQTFGQDGIHFNGNLHLRDARVSYDVYPFRKSFRISAGVAVYNQLSAKAAALVPGGQTVTFNDVDYYSSQTVPLHGNATIADTRKVAPVLTFGWGNAIPRSGRHLAFPVEIGVAFAGTPDFNLVMTGSACGSQDPTTCRTVTTDPDFQSNLNVERKKISRDLEVLRFYPIINVGATYRF